MLAREAPSTVRAAGIHDRRARLLERLRHGGAADHLEELPVEVELRFVAPQPLNDGQPLREVVVPLVVLPQRGAEHVQLRLVPAADDVKAEASARDQVDGSGLLGRDDRMDGRGVGCGEHGGMGRGLRDASRPGERVHDHAAGMAGLPST